MARCSNRLNFERLENRDLMSGNVIARVNFDFGTGFHALFVNEAVGQGGQANSIQITKLANGATRVSGLLNPDGTRPLVNGLAFQDFGDDPLELIVELGGGNDRLRITTDPHRAENGQYAAVTIGMSDPHLPPDADTVELTRLATDLGVDISTGAGSDHVVVRDANIGFLSNSSLHGDLTISTGAGVDHVDVGANDGTFVRVHGNLIVNTFESITEPDTDVVHLFQTTVDQTIGVSTGGGNDFVRMGVVFGEDVSMVTGQGNDTGLLQDVRAGDHMFLGMSEGNDSLDVSGLEAVNLLTIDGFSGFDRLQDHADGAIGKKVVTGWEVINGVLVTGSHGGTVGGLGGGGTIGP